MGKSLPCIGLYDMIEPINQEILRDNLLHIFGRRHKHKPVI